VKGRGPRPLDERDTDHFDRFHR